MNQTRVGATDMRAGGRITVKASDAERESTRVAMQIDAKFPQLSMHLSELGEITLFSERRSCSIMTSEFGACFSNLRVLWRSELIYIARFHQFPLNSVPVAVVLFSRTFVSLESRKLYRVLVHGLYIREDNYPRDSREALADL